MFALHEEVCPTFVNCCEIATLILNERKLPVMSEKEDEI